MTDAEKMREAAAQWCADEADRCEDAAKWGGHRKYVQDCKAAAYALRNAWSKILALPVPVDASAPAADCQQAELVTVDAGLLDEVKAALRTASESLEWCARGRMASASLETYPTSWAASTRAALARLEREVG